MNTNRQQSWTDIGQNYALTINLLEGLVDIASSAEVLDGHYALELFNRLNGSLRVGPSLLIEQINSGSFERVPKGALRNRLSALRADIESFRKTGGKNTIRESLADRSIEPETLLVWNALNELYGRYVEIMQAIEDSQPAIKNQDEGALHHSTLLQKCWHAVWIVRNSKPDLSDRRQQEDDLAEVCDRILNKGTLLPPAPFPKDWFGLVDEHGYLKTAYTHANKKTLIRLASLPGVTPLILPSLKMADFKSSNRPRGLEARLCDLGRPHMPITGERGLL